MEKKLSKSQKKLVASWEKELGSRLQSVNAGLQQFQQVLTQAINEILESRLELLARTEIDIDLDDGDWRYDPERASFIKQEEPKEVIPSGKKHKTKETNKKIN